MDENFLAFVSATCDRNLKDWHRQSLLKTLRDSPKGAVFWVKANLRQWAAAYSPAMDVTTDPQKVSLDVVAHLQKFFAKEIEALPAPAPAENPVSASA